MLTSDQVQSAFKAFGKLIKLGELADDYADTLKLHQMATTDQVAEANADAYPIFRGVVIPLELSVGRTIASVESVRRRRGRLGEVDRCRPSRPLRHRHEV